MLLTAILIERKKITRMGVYVRKEAHIENNLKFQNVWPFTATLIKGQKIMKVGIYYMWKGA